MQFVYQPLYSQLRENLGFKDVVNVLGLLFKKVDRWKFPGNCERNSILNMHWSLKLPALLASLLLTAGTSVEGSGQVLTHQPRDPTSEYLICPSDHYDVLEFEQKLYNVVPQSSVYTAEFCVFGVLYWTTRLTSAQVKLLEDPSVGYAWITLLRSWSSRSLTEVKTRSKSQTLAPAAMTNATRHPSILLTIFSNRLNNLHEMTAQKWFSLLCFDAIAL